VLAAIAHDARDHPAVGDAADLPIESGQSGAAEAGGETPPAFRVYGSICTSGIPSASGRLPSGRGVVACATPAGT
jgi:hypothetical protein